MNSFNRQYYCFVAGLPELTFDQQKVAYTVQGFRDALFDVLHPSDNAWIKWVLLPVDNQNLLSILLKTGKLFLHHGNLSLHELEEGIREPEILPDYLSGFVTEFRISGGVEPPEGWENRLTSLYYQHAAEVGNPFLRNWFGFNLMLNNILVAYTCRKFRMGAEDHFIGDDEVIGTMKKSQARDFGIIADVPFVDRVISILENKDLLERERGLDLLRWQYLDDQTTFHYFSVEVILSYLIKLMILERWLQLDPVSGSDTFGRIHEELRSFEFSRDFQIHERNK